MHRQTTTLTVVFTASLLLMTIASCPSHLGSGSNRLITDSPDRALESFSRSYINGLDRNYEGTMGLAKNYEVTTNNGLAAKYLPGVDCEFLNQEQIEDPQYQSLSVQLRVATYFAAGFKDKPTVDAVFFSSDSTFSEIVKTIRANSSNLVEWSINENFGSLGRGNISYDADYEYELPNNREYLFVSAQSSVNTQLKQTYWTLIRLRFDD